MSHITIKLVKDWFPHRVGAVIPQFPRGAASELISRGIAEEVISEPVKRPVSKPRRRKKKAVDNA